MSDNFHRSRILHKLIVAALAVSFLLSAAGCNKKTEDTGNSEVYKVAFLMPHLTNPFMNNLSDAVKKYANEAGIELTLQIANNDVEKQISQINEAVRDKVDAIILDPCSGDELADAVKAAQDAKIPVITLHESITTQQYCVSYAGPDFSNGGKQAMQRAMADLPDGGNIAIVYGMEGHSAQIIISSGYPEALKGQESKYPIVKEGYGNWNTADAKALVKEWLNSGIRIDSIVCNNDGMASGALEAVTEVGFDGIIKIYGLDAQKNILDAIKEGAVSGTIFTDFDSEAKKSIEIVQDILAGKPVLPEYLMPMILITAENVDIYLQ